MKYPTVHHAAYNLFSGSLQPLHGGHPTRLTCTTSAEDLGKCHLYQDLDQYQCDFISFLSLLMPIGHFEKNTPKNIHYPQHFSSFQRFLVPKSAHLDFQGH